LIQGTALVVTDKDVGMVKVTLTMTIMVVVATVEDGPVTLAAAETDWVQAAIVAPPGAMLRMAEDPEAGMLLDGVELAVTATTLVAVEAAGDQLQVLLMLLVGGGVSIGSWGAASGGAKKVVSQHRMVEAARWWRTGGG
jgi:hypothetical protein